MPMACTHTMNTNLEVSMETEHRRHERQGRTSLRCAGSHYMGVHSRQSYDMNVDYKVVIHKRSSSHTLSSTEDKQEKTGAVQRQQQKEYNPEERNERKTRVKNAPQIPQLKNTSRSMHAPPSPNRANSMLSPIPPSTVSHRHLPVPSLTSPPTPTSYTVAACWAELTPITGDCARPSMLRRDSNRGVA